MFFGLVGRVDGRTHQVRRKRALCLSERELFQQLDPEAFGRQLSDVAIDLFHTSPELAIELVSRRGGQNSTENAFDWAIAGLAIQAHLVTDDPNAKNHARNLHDQIKDPTLRRLSMHAVAILGNLPASEVITEASRLESTGDKLFLLQRWMAANHTRSDASDVLEHGLRLAIHATSYTASATVYRQLAVCLPHISEPERRNELIELLDGQKAVLEKLGPQEDYIRLLLIIARTVALDNEDQSHERLLSIYNDVVMIDDPVVKVAAAARLAGTLARIDPGRRLDEELHTLVDQELEDGTTRLLLESAEHFEVCRGVIKALAVTRPKSALSVVQKINTEWRRDLGYQAFIETAVAAPLAEVPFGEIGQALDQIIDPAISTRR